MGLCIYVCSTHGCKHTSRAECLRRDALAARRPRPTRLTALPHVAIATKPPLPRHRVVTLLRWRDPAHLALAKTTSQRSSWTGLASPGLRTSAGLRARALLPKSRQRFSLRLRHRSRQLRAAQELGRHRSRQLRAAQELGQSMRVHWANLARMWHELAPSRSLWHESRMLQRVPRLGAEDQLDAAE